MALEKVLVDKAETLAVKAETLAVKVEALVVDKVEILVVEWEDKEQANLRATLEMKDPEVEAIEVADKVLVVDKVEAAEEVAAVVEAEVIVNPHEHVQEPSLNKLVLESS